MRAVVVPGNVTPHEHSRILTIRILDSSRQLATGQDLPRGLDANVGMSGGAHCLNVEIQKQMLITLHDQDIVSSYIYWKFKSTNSSDYVKRAHPTPRRHDV